MIRYLNKKCKLISKLLIPVFFIMLLAPTLNVQAAPDGDTEYESWIVNPYEDEITIDGWHPHEMPDEEEEEGSSWLPDWMVDLWDTVTEPFKPDSIEQHLGSLFFRLATFLGRKFEANGDYANITIDGLILGRLAEGTYSYSIAQFGLEEGNPYGVAGAKVFVILRNTIYGLFLVYACFLLVSQSLQNSSKAWLTLKESLTGIVFAFMLTYLMPQIIEAFLVIRDGWIVEIANGIAGAGSQGESVSSFYAQEYINDPENGLVAAILLFALQFANLFYIGGYVAVAIQCCVMFAIFPVIALLSLKQKKMFTDWCAIFFSNLAIPLIDYMLFLIPTMIHNAVGEVNFVTGIVTLMIVWQIIPARNAILRLLGNATATNAGRGMAGLGAMGMMAMRMLMGKGGGGKNTSSEGGGNEGFFESRSKARAAEREGEVLGGSLQNRALEMQDVDSLMSEAGTEHSHATFSPAIDTVTEDGSGGSGLDAEVLSDSSGDETGKTFETETEKSEFTVPEGVSGEGAPSASDGDVVDLGSVINAGSMDEYAGYYEGGTFKPQNVDMTFDDMRLRNLENMENTHARIEELETNLPKLKEDYVAKQAEMDGHKETVDYAEKNIKKNDATINNLEKQNANLTDDLKTQSGAERANTQQQIDKNQQQIQQLREKNVELEQKKTYAEGKVNDTKLQAELQTASATYTSHVTQLSKAKEAYTKQVAIERNFANAREITGGSGKVYENAAQFRDSHQMQEVKKKHINHMNFDTSVNTRMLSPQERADFYRQRAVYQATRKTVGVASAITVGGISATAATFGGPGAMVTAGVVGGMAGDAAGKKVGGAAYNAGLSASEAATKALDVEAKVNTGKTAAVEDRRMFGAKKGKQFSDTSKNSSQKQSGSKGDTFEEHVNRAREGHKQLNEQRGRELTFQSNGDDDVTKK